MRHRLCISLLAAAGVSLAAAAPALADCQGLDAQVKAAISSGDIGALPALADQISKDTSCDSTYVDHARRAMALSIMSAGQKEDGSAPPEFVKGAAAIARPWQVAMALGDLKYDEKDYAGAVEAYESAINDIRNVKLVPKAPEPAIEKYLAQRAYQAKSLAPTYVASRGFRGEPTGVMVPTFRNFTAVSVPVPIRFETGESALTPDGVKAVDDLYNFLKGQKLTAIVLIGHTDERGSPSYNDQLSAARAQAVAEALHQRGIDYTIKTEGHGEREPFQADDRSKYSEEDLFAFDRRVEFKIVQ